MKSLASYWCKSACLTLVGFFCINVQASKATTVCQTASLSDYMSLNQGGGCQDGDLTFFRFSFSSAGNASLASASDITVTPFLNGNTAGFTFTSSFFQLTNPTQSESATYNIGYSEDPPPIIVGQGLRLDPPYGNVLLSQNICANDVLVNNCTFGTPFSESVTPSNPVSSVYFPSAVFFVDQNTQINLQASPGNPAGFDSIEVDSFLSAATTATPEPSSVYLLAFGSLLLVGTLGRRYFASN